MSLDKVKEICSREGLDFLNEKDGMLEIRVVRENYCFSVDYNKRSISKKIVAISKLIPILNERNFILVSYNSARDGYIKCKEHEAFKFYLEL